MRRIWLVCVCFLINGLAFSQNCTVTGTSPLNWVNPGPNCNEGGNAGSKSVLIIPAGFTLTFDNVADTWSGTRVEIYGVLEITADVTINSSVVVKNGGVLALSAKLSLGTSAGCGYSINVNSGGTVDVGGTGSDRLSVCGADMMKGNGSCNSCGGTNSGTCAYDGNPYCEPAGGFTGPSGYGEGGYDPALPITLMYFNGKQNRGVIELNWATATEQNFHKFIVQHSDNGIDFHDIGEVAAKGSLGHGIETKYSFQDRSPLLGINYYRLKSIDLDDTFEIYYIIAVKEQGGKKLHVYPNPSQGESISFELNFIPEEGGYVTIVDQVGSELLRIPVAQNTNELVLQHKLSPGIYAIKYTSQTSQLVSMLVVKQ
jgi:hypothetical protein